MITITDKEKQRIQAWNRRQEELITLNLVSSGRADGSPMSDFCDALSDFCSNIKLVKKIDDTIRISELRITDRIVYSAVPLQKELDPFLDALSIAGKKNGDELFLKAAGDLAGNLAGITVPVRCKLYMALQCPHCPKVVNTMLLIAGMSDQVFVHIIDGSLFPEEAAADSVMSAPCLILDDDFRWVGNVTPLEVTDYMVNRDPAKLSAASLKMILEEGKASWITARMMEKNQIFPGFIELVTHEVWSVRLGAMVVLEELAEEAPVLAATVSKPLMALFDSVALPIKGDILYALGETGDHHVKKQLMELMDGLADSELTEAAKEAVEAIGSRG